MSFSFLSLGFFFFYVEVAERKQGNTDQLQDTRVIQQELVGGLIRLISQQNLTN